MAIHTSHPDMGYRRISDELNRRYDVHVNEKRILQKADPKIFGMGLLKIQNFVVLLFVTMVIEKTKKQ